MFREVARIKQKLGKEDCVALLKSEKRGVLSVIGDGGYPYGMPMNHFYCEEDGKLYFHSGMRGHRTDAIAACDKASYCVFDEGYVNEGEWAKNVKSVIIFGRIEIIRDRERIADIARRLSYKFTGDEKYIEDEIRESIDHTMMFALVPEHMTGKKVCER